MDVLKKYNGGTLIENLVAIVILVLLFLLSSSVLQYVFLHGMNQEKEHLEYVFDRDFYDYKHKKFSLPIMKVEKNWYVKYRLIQGTDRVRYFQMEAVHKINQNTIIKHHVLD